jgi:hypothetical protein
MLASRHMAEGALHVLNDWGEMCGLSALRIRRGVADWSAERQALL